LLSPFAFSFEIRVLQKQKTHGQFISGGGLKNP